MYRFCSLGEMKTEFKWELNFVFMFEGAFDEFYLCILSLPGLVLAGNRHVLA